MHQSCSDPALNSTSPDPIQHSIEYVMNQHREKKSSGLKLSNCAQDNTAKHLKQITVFTLWKLSLASATTHKSPKHQTPNIQMFLSFPEGQCERHTKDTWWYKTVFSGYLACQDLAMIGAFNFIDWTESYRVGRCFFQCYKRTWPEIVKKDGSPPKVVRVRGSWSMWIESCLFIWTT